MADAIQMPLVAFRPSDRVYARLAILAAQQKRSIEAVAYDLVKMAVLPEPQPQGKVPKVKRPTMPVGRSLLEAADGVS